MNKRKCLVCHTEMFFNERKQEYSCRNMECMICDTAFLTAQIAHLEKALELACQQVDKSGTAPCDEQCERGKGCIDCLIHHYMQKSKEAAKCQK
jgi:hypothetical protein